MPHVLRLAGRRIDDAPRRIRRGTLAAIFTTGILATAGCAGGHPRTEVLRSANPLTSDIWVRITGPGGAVGYVGRRFTAGGAFSKFSFTKDRGEGLFLPPTVRDRKLCSSTHTIQLGDAPALQRWRGRRLAITVYGRKISTIFCAALTSDLYAAGP